MRGSFIEPPLCTGPQPVEQTGHTFDAIENQSLD
jgi:hypothetical protein